MTFRQSNRQATDHQVARQVTGVAVLLIGVKGLAALKEVMLARTYGVGDLMDAYQFDLQLIGWAPSIFLAICSAALVPAYASLRGQQGGQLERFRAQVHGVSLVLSALLAMTWLLLNAWTPLLNSWSGLSAAALHHAANMTQPMALMLGASMYVGLLTAECIAASLQGVTLMEAAPSVVLIAMLVLTVSGDATFLIAATVGGTLVQMFLLAGYIARHSGLPRPTLLLDHPQWRTVLAALAALLLAQVMQAATNIVDQFWAARSGNGALSVMAYANRLLFLAIGIGSTAVTRVLLPLLSDLSIKGKALARRAAWQWALGLIALSALVAMLLWPSSAWIVKIVFERGAFGPQDTQRVATFLQFSWLQLPPYLGSLVLIQLVLAESKYRILAWLTAFNLAVKLIANSILAPHFGINGLAMSTAIMQLCLLLMLLAWFRRTRDA